LTGFYFQKHISMKKCLLFFSIVLCFVIRTNSQTITSVTDGNFYMPTTWDCSCLPLPTYTINVNHNVVLDNDFALNGGSLTIGTNGILRENVTGRYLTMATGTIVNHGKIKVSRVGFYGGDFTNLDSCLFYSVFYSGAYVNNMGSITEVDSLFIESYFYNDAAGSIAASKVSVNDTLENNGVLNITDLLNLHVFYNNNVANFHNFYSNNVAENDDIFTYNDFSNHGTFENYGSMHGNDDASNHAYFYNDPTASFIVENDFSNIDSVNHLALFENDGAVYVAGNFYNRDSITGDGGHICVGQASTNAGVMTGPFDFCDLANGGPPDFNTGTIGSDVTYCQNSCAEEIGKNELSLQHLDVYPNPTEDNLYFEFAVTPQNASIIITDLLGNSVFALSDINTKMVAFEKGNLPAGLYIYQVKTDSKLFSGKILLQ